MRLTLSESAERVAARSETIEFSRIRDLFRAPTVYALLATGLCYATCNLGANNLGRFGTFL
ncbi:hypothetical protein ACW4TU_03935 [Streptomyces sp. QTS52]